MKFFIFILSYHFICNASTNDNPLLNSLAYFKNGINFEHQPTNFKSTLRFRVQNRFTYESQSEEKLKADTVDFTVRRMRLRMEGHVLDPRLIYRFQFSFTRGDMDYDRTNYPNILRDSVIGWKFSDNSTLLYGQMKLPGNRQRIISSGQQQFVDRSIVNAMLNIDRDIGLQWHSQLLENHPLILKLAITNGEGRSVANNNSGLAYTSRLEWLPLGAFKDEGDNFEGDLAFEDSVKIAFGTAYSTNKKTNKTGGQIGTQWSSSNIQRDLDTLLADFLVKYRGISFSSEFIQRWAYGGSLHFTDQGTEYTIFEGYGYNAQTGYLFKNNWESSLRYSQLRASSQTLLGENNQKQYTLALSKYLNRHLVKFQSDLSLNHETNPIAGTNEKEFIFRLQFELGI
jgi:phosphate-selective porin OprO/OprP